MCSSECYDALMAGIGKPYEERRQDAGIQKFDMKELQRRLNELEATLTTVLTDPNYVGGVRYWIKQHDEMALKNAELLLRITKLEIEINSLKPRKGIEM